jgi:hypothetical protein
VEVPLDCNFDFRVTGSAARTEECLTFLHVLSITRAADGALQTAAVARKLTVAEAGVPI